MNAHEQIHRDLGVYVLGALGPAERDRVERHLVDCDVCRDELAALAALPSLLARALPAADETPQLPPSGAVIERIARERRVSRRRQRMAAGLAAIAVLVAFAVVSAPLLSRPASQSFVADTGGVTALVQQRDWGMAVSISAERLPADGGYVAVAVAKDGHRTQVASWTSTAGPATVEGACYLAPEDLDRMEVLSTPGEDVVAVLRPGPG